MCPLLLPPPKALGAGCAVNRLQQAPRTGLMYAFSARAISVSPASMAGPHAWLNRQPATWETSSLAPGGCRHSTKNLYRVCLYSVYR
jgi:hypothetical protein